MSKNRLSHDQKRKAKLKKRAERSPRRESLAYEGNKYKTAEFVLPLFRTEFGIFTAYVMSDRTMTDASVVAALELLIERLRAGNLPPPPEANERRIPADLDDEDGIIWHIRDHWQMLAEAGSLPRRADLVGILRTILNSVEIWHAKGILSQGYLRYLEGFMKQSGASVQIVDNELEPLPEPAADPLLELGRRWIEARDHAAGIEFRQQAGELFDTGGANRVVEVCQQLIGESGGSPYIAELQALSLRGHQVLQLGSPFERPLP
jgi:hypothetical protein